MIPIEETPDDSTSGVNHGVDFNGLNVSERKQRQVVFLIATNCVEMFCQQRKKIYVEGTFI